MIKAVYIMPDVRKKMQAYIDGCPEEISGLGTVEVDGDYVYITDIFLIKQEVGPGSTILDPASLAEFMVEAHKNGVDTGKIKWWWHSHVNMGCGWSLTDQDNIDGLRPKDFFISTVGNKRGEECTRIDIYDPLRVFMDKVPLATVQTVEEAEIIRAAKEEIKLKVTHIPAKIYTWPGKGGARGQGGKGGKVLPLLLPEAASDYDPEEVYKVDDYRNFAEGMGMSLQALLIEEGKCIFGEYVIDSFDDRIQ